MICQIPKKLKMEHCILGKLIQEKFVILIQAHYSLVIKI